MARIRTIKPEFWTDGTIVQLPFQARLLFVGMWNFADDYGALWNEPERIKMQVFPSDDVEIDHLIDLLIATGRLEAYDAPNGDRYLFIPRWSDHQRVDKPSKSQIPTREESRKVAIPLPVRRAVAAKYGCTPGTVKDVTCFYCGNPGSIHWWTLANGKPSGWVTFSGLELDHFEPESEGGKATNENLVLACRSCNRAKHSTNGQAFLAERLPLFAEDSRVLLRGRERKVKERKVIATDVAKTNGHVTWPVEGSQLWTEKVGPITPARFGHALKPVVDRSGWDDTKAGLEAYIELQEGKARRVEWYANDSVRWIKLGKMPMIDPNTGAFTERGRIVEQMVRRES